MASPKDASFQVGQLVNIAGTGKWHDGTIYAGKIVEVRSEDNTVKLQFSGDGSYKRYKLGDFKKLTSAAGSAPTGGGGRLPPRVGQPVYMAGTGSWYQNQHFGAVVVDIREEDDTVKVQYTDGGYKRMKLSVYNSLVTDNKQAPEMWEEWSPALHDEHVSELNVLHEDIMASVRKRDFLRADELQKRYIKLSNDRDTMKSLEIKLQDCLARGNYAGAHQVQEEINKVAGKSAGDTVKAAPPAELGFVAKAAKRALGGGMAGASAMVLQVSTLMWMRTTMNYQYRYGTSTVTALRTLYADGGIPRFYRGIGPALIQGPISRFGDTFANAGVMALFDETEAKNWPSPVKTVFASAAAASMRIVLVPVDTVKTMMQVEGKDGLVKLRAKYAKTGPTVFFHGATATCAATFAGHYPWFTTFNTLNDFLPNYEERSKKLLRNAGIGFCASLCSDTVSNSLRVVKTVRQTNDTLPYRTIVQNIIEQDGVMGLFGRGLKTRLIANGCQGIMFSVLYKMFEEKYNKR